jgi:Bacteriophage Sf6, terminase small subunit-like
VSLPCHALPFVGSEPLGGPQGIFAAIRAYHLLTGKSRRMIAPMRGRPSIFSPELADRLCERLADGETLRAICRDEGMPDERTVRRWALDDLEGFSTQYARAREIGYQGMADYGNC